MKQVIRKILMVIVALGILTGCTLPAQDSLINDDKNQYSKEETAIDSEEHFVHSDTEGVIPFTMGTYPRLAQSSPHQVEPGIDYPILIHFESYEEFIESGYDNTFYNEAYFEKKGLILFIEFDHVVGTKVVIHHLFHEDGILTVHANMQRPEVAICLYAPREYCFAIQYDLIKGLESVVGETTQVAVVEYFNFPADITKVEERLSHPFVNVEVVLLMDPKGYDNNTRDAYMQEKYDLYGVEEEGITTSIGVYILIITYEICTMEEINQYFSVLSDPDIQSIGIYIRNFSIE